jgi:hypothetical protein
MLAVVAPAASVNIVKSHSLLNDASHSAAHTHGFLLAEVSCSSLKISTLKGFEKKVGVSGSEYLVWVINRDAELEESQGGKKLLRIRITAEVDGVRSDYTISFGRYGGSQRG